MEEKYKVAKAMGGKRLYPNMLSTYDAGGREAKRRWKIALGWLIGLLMGFALGRASVTPSETVWGEPPTEITIGAEQ